MIDFVAFKWKPNFRYRSQFLPKHVNVLYNMIGKHYKGEWRFTLITDDATGIDPRIRIIPLWDDYANLDNPSAPKRGPSCYRRLKVFKADANEWLGQRIMLIDIDCVIVDDITPVVERPEDFVIWGDTNKNTPYNGSLILFNAGARAKLWDEFHPTKSPAATRKRGYYGSDQAWISHCLGTGEAKFGPADGVYSYRNEVKGEKLPKGARIVVMHGAVDPWSPQAQRLAWVKQHWK